MRRAPDHTNIDGTTDKAASAGAVGLAVLVLAIGAAAWLSLQSDRYVMRGEGTLTVILDTATGEVRSCYSDRAGGTCHSLPLDR